jgi:precorrin-8X/cobalt-precorrin-8 methylmutase
MHNETGAAITQASFAIIRAELQTLGYRFPPPLDAIVERIIHSTADFDFAQSTKFSANAVEAGIAALQKGSPIVADVQMVRIGISAGRVSALGGSVHCFVAEENVRRRALEGNRTRSAMGMRYAAELGLLEGAVVAVGNAPTAVFEVISLIDAGVRPALVIGVPVGFVATAESKAALMCVTAAPWIVTEGRKGGSPVAVAIVNALLRLAVGVVATEVD